MLHAFAGVATDGKFRTPHLLLHAKANAVRPEIDFVDPNPVDIPLDPVAYQYVMSGMRQVVTAGTAKRAEVPGFDVCGKTGTAQVISNTGRSAARTTRNLRDHGWFVFFAPRDNPEIAGVVFLEHGIHGPNAATVAHHILNTYFAKRDGLPLPAVPTHDEMHLDYKDPYARGGVAIGGGLN
jgi:penicillin-binding protein 2